MSEPLPSFTPTDLMASASAILKDAGYRQVTNGFPEWNTPSSRLFEDEYNIVGLVVFATYEDLMRGWADRQGVLVDLISEYVGKSESKSWDGYLVLLTPAIAPSEQKNIEALRYNTTRLRKLVATGDDLKHPADVERVLKSLLPLSRERIEVSRSSALDLLPRLLATEGIDQQVTRRLIDAFKEQKPLMEQLHERGVDL
jgi:hypothetical protein